MSIIRALRALLLACAAMLVPTVVAAHAVLTESVPAESAQLDQPPTEVVLTFNEEIGADSAFVVSDAAGTEVGTGGLDLNVADRNVLRGDVSISAVGTYTVTWTVTSADGDTVEGSYAFSVARSAPNTAVGVGASASASVVTLLGLLVLAVAARLGRELMGRTH